MRLQTMTLDNFKGINHLEIDFHGHDADIYGDNATGKTTIYDAFLWLLFGKDSSGRQDFEVKPLAPDGTVRDHGVEVSVAAVLDTDDGPYTLQRTLREKWAKKRGSTAPEMTGNETGFVVDGLPVGKAQYMTTVDSIIPEDQFRVLTDPYYFPERLKWQDRRNILFDCFGLLTDADVVQARPELAPLLEAMGRHTVQEMRTILMADHKRTAEELGKLPVRIDEAHRSIQPEADAAAAAKAIESLEAERADLERQLNTSTGAGIAELAAQIRVVTEERKALIARNEAHRAQQINDLNADRRARAKPIMDQIDALPCVAVAYGRRADDQGRELQRQIEEARAEWEQVNNRAIAVDATCPTCGQDIPADQVEAARVALEAQKAKELAAITERGKELTARLKAAMAEAKDRWLQIHATEDERDALQRQLDAIAGEPCDISDMPDYATFVKSLDDREQALRRTMDDLQRDGERDQAPIKQRIAETTWAIQAHRQAQIIHTANLQQRARIEELQAKLQELQQHQDEVEQLQAMCDQFTAIKAHMVQEEINSRFGLVTFRLFDAQINGGLVDTCKVMVDGVPYDDLNHAAQINAGLDIINTLAAHYNAWAPIYIDNAESVTNLLHTDAQTIRLIVSEQDKDLRVEIKEEQYGTHRVA